LPLALPLSMAGDAGCSAALAHEPIDATTFLRSARRRKHASTAEQTDVDVTALMRPG